MTRQQWDLFFAKDYSSGKSYGIIISFSFTASQHFALQLFITLIEFNEHETVACFLHII